jgi:magnesium chelatase family protein
MDMHVQLPPVDVASLGGQAGGEPSADVRARVIAARERQHARYLAGDVSANVNALLSPRDLERVAMPDAAGMRLIVSAVERLGLSARAYGKILRVARTIADLDQSPALTAAHVVEAVQARVLDRTPILAA